MNRFARIAYVFAFGLLGICTVGSIAAPDDSGTAHSAAAVRDGSHDFDFIYGKWRMPNHHLKKRLAVSNEWDDFITCDEGSPLPGGIGDIDYWKASFWKDFVGVTVAPTILRLVSGGFIGSITPSLEVSFSRR